MLRTFLFRSCFSGGLCSPISSSISFHSSAGRSVFREHWSGSTLACIQGLLSILSDTFALIILNWHYSSVLNYCIKFRNYSSPKHFLTLILYIYTASWNGMAFLILFQVGNSVFLNCHKYKKMPTTNVLEFYLKYKMYVWTSMNYSEILCDRPIRLRLFDFSALLTYFIRLSNINVILRNVLKVE